MEPTLPDQHEHEHEQPLGDNDSAADVAVDSNADADVAADVHDSSKVVHELSLRDDRLRSLVGLELPFYASNVERVLETIGGLESMQQSHENKSQFLSVKLRPSEPSCKPLFADLAKTQTILLRVRRKRKHTSDAAPAATPASTQQTDASSDDTVMHDPLSDDMATIDPSGGIHAEIVGLVREAYVCEGMADFQYFTSRTFYPDAGAEAAAAAHEQQLNPNAPVVHGSSAQLALKASLRPYLRVQRESELEMIPEVFSKVDLPLKYEFRQRSGYQPTESSKKASSTMTYLNFHDDVAAPAEPKPENPIMRRRPIGAHDAVDDHVLRVLQDKLAQKPVWLRPKLFVGFDVLERRAARRLLRKLCYVFVDGPWRGSWIRMGYDPRTSPDSAKYQVIELRNNRELVHAKVTHPSRKRTKKFSGINPKGPRIVKVTQTSENESAQASKRRRKERFMLSDTRRAYLADADSVLSSRTNEQAQSQQVDTALDTGDGSNEWDSDQEFADDGNDAASVASSATNSAAAHHQGTPTLAGPRTNERLFEIFGVPLTSANVLFQLDEIDDDEVRAWVAQFAMLNKPTLLGGWFSPHVFLPLREVVRYRIAALVGRSKADLDARRKRIEALKKQALADYTEQLATGDKNASKSSRENGTDAGADADADAEDLVAVVDATIDATTVASIVAQADDMGQVAFEESLAREHAASRVPNAVAVTAGNSTSKARAVAGAVEGPEAVRVGEVDNDECDDGLEFDEEDEIHEEEEDAAMSVRKERLQRGGGGIGSDEDEDEDDGDEDESDNDAAGQESRTDSRAMAQNPAVDEKAVVSASVSRDLVCDAAAPNSVDSTVSDEALEYSF